MTIKLAVTQRDESINNKDLRASGGLPAIVYGPKQEPVKVSLPLNDFDKVLKEAGESTIIELSGLKKKLEVLIKDVDFDPIKNQVRHVDLYAVEEGKEITTSVPLNFIGEAPAEHLHVGVVTKVMHEVEVTCKPSDLPGHLDVSLESLSAVGDKVHVEDIKLPKGVLMETDANESVAVVSAIKEETEEKPEPIDLDSVEVEAKGKTEGGEAQSDATKEEN